MDGSDIRSSTRDRADDPRRSAEEQRQSARDVRGSRERGNDGRRDRDDSRPRLREGEDRGSRDRAARPKLLDRERGIALRQSQLHALSEIGTFRTVDVKDLARFAYRGDEQRTREDLRYLEAQGLVKEKTLSNAYKQPRQILTLTKEGDRLLRAIGDLPRGQQTYHGFVKPREQDHDADLYKVYRKAVEEIEKNDGRVRKVRLDFELKASLNRQHEAARRLSADLKEKFLESLARENGLSVRNKKIAVPDLQIEYETADRQLLRENLELITRDYREAGIRAKADSGFKIYARAGDANRIQSALRDPNRVRRALQDSGALTKVLSL